MRRSASLAALAILSALLFTGCLPVYGPAADLPMKPIHSWSDNVNLTILTSYSDIYGYNNSERARLHRVSGQIGLRKRFFMGMIGVSPYVGRYDVKAIDDQRGVKDLHGFTFMGEANFVIPYRAERFGVGSYFGGGAESGQYKRFYQDMDAADRADISQINGCRSIHAIWSHSGEWDITGEAGIISGGEGGWFGGLSAGRGHWLGWSEVTKASVHWGVQCGVGYRFTLDESGMRK
jgi:hypothetical protein